MKLLIVNPCYYPAFRYGGPIKSVHELGKKLFDFNADVTVFTTNADGPHSLDVPLGKEVDVDGVKAYYFPVEKLRSYFRSPQLAAALKDNIRDFDVVHINWLYVYPTLVAARECIRQKVPYIMSPRGMLDPNAIAMKGTFKKKAYLALVEKKNLNSSNAVHFTSEGERDQAVAGGWQGRSVVVPNGVNLPSYDKTGDDKVFYSKFPELNGKKKILFLGRLNYIKGLDVLAGAWATVVQAVPEAHLVLAGPDDAGYGEKVRGWLAGEGVEKNATFTGMLIDNDKLSALNSCDIFVASSYLESFGIAIVEAMACRKPVVITDRVNICREVENAGAGRVVPCTSAQIADALIDILKNPRQGIEMGLRGRQLVEEKFTWDRAAKEMMTVYEDILSERRTSPAWRDN